MNRGPLISLAGAFILLIFVLAGYGFWYSMLSQKSAEVSSIVTQISKQEDATSKIEQAKAELDQLSTQESSVNQYFVATSDVVPFLEQIQAIGKFLGAKVEVVSVSAIPGTPYGQLSLSLSITGSFDAVARTIGSIEYGPYDTQITSLTFSTTPSPTGTAPTAANSVWTADAQFNVGAQTGSSQAAAVGASPTAQTSATSTPQSTSTAPVTTATAPVTASQSSTSSSSTGLKAQ